MEKLVFATHVDQRALGVHDPVTGLLVVLPGKSFGRYWPLHSRNTTQDVLQIEIMLFTSRVNNVVGDCRP